MSDDVTEGRPRKAVGDVVRFQRHAREGNNTGKAVSEPAMPARVRIAVGENGGYRECGNPMAGREAPDTTKDMAPAVLPKPSVGEISVRGDIPWVQSAISIFHHRRQDLGVNHCFGRKQERMLRIRVPTQQIDAIKDAGNGHHADRSVAGAKNSVESTVGATSPEVTRRGCIGCDKGSGDVGDDESRHEAMPPSQRNRKKPDLLLV